MVKYYVDKDARKVVCVIDGCRTMFVDYLRSLDDKYHIDYEMHYPYGKHHTDLYLSDSFRGIATCDENDEWDETVGRRLAYHKARWKQSKAFFAAAQRYVNELERQINFFAEHVDNYGDHLAKHHAKRDEELKAVLHNKE